MVPKRMGRIPSWGVVGRMLVALLVAGCAPSSVPAGSLDPSFGKGGIVATDHGLFADFGTLALQPDGRIVVAGKIKFDFALARYTPDGKLDPGFGSSGTVTTDIGGMDYVNAVALQPDGRIIAVGQITVFSSPPSYDFALARYTPDGKLDPSFGRGGIVRTDVGGIDDANAVALQPDGRIVVVGSTGPSGGEDYAVVRYVPDGNLDPSFGRGGIVRTDVGGIDHARAVALQPDGRIVVAGTVLARYTSDGTLDPSFGSGGIVKTRGFGSFSAVALQPDGKVVAGGSTYPVQVAGDFAFARYTPDGTLDASLGSGGVVKTLGSLFPGAVAFQPDGKVVMGGSTGQGGGDFAVARYTPGGTLDPSFGGGTVTTDIGGSDSGIRAIALQPDGKIVVAGHGRPGCRGFVGLCTSGVPSELVLARYQGN